MLCCQGALTGFHKAWLAAPLDDLIKKLDPITSEPIGAISYCPALASLIRLHPLKSLGKCNSAPHITRVKSHPKNRRPRLVVEESDISEAVHPAPPSKPEASVPLQTKVWVAELP